MKTVKQEFLEYLETWSDSSLENLVLIYRGEGQDVDISKCHDEKIRKLFKLIETLRMKRRFDDIQEIYEAIESLCRG